MRRLTKIVPKTATPIAPPIWRESVEPDVATPSSRYSTAFCDASTSTCIVIPSPSPTTSIAPVMYDCEVPESSCDSSAIPTAVMNVPTTGNGL